MVICVPCNGDDNVDDSPGDSCGCENRCVCNNGHWVYGSLWKEHLYLEVQAHAQDQRFFNNALKSGHIEGKMSAREMQFTRGLTSPVGNVAPTG